MSTKTDFSDDVSARGEKHEKVIVTYLPTGIYINVTDYNDKGTSMRMSRETAKEFFKALIPSDKL